MSILDIRWRISSSVQDELPDHIHSVLYKVRSYGSDNDCLHDITRQYVRSHQPWKEKHSYFDVQTTNEWKEHQLHLWHIGQRKKTD